MLIASFCFAIVGAFAKILSQNMPSIEVVFFRNFIGVILLFLTIFKYPIRQKGGKYKLLFFRGFAGLVGLLSFFYNIAHMPLADAMTFSRTSPIWTALFAYWFLNERIGFKGWVAIGIGFLGMVFIMKPNGFMLEKTDITGIISGLSAGMAYTSVRELRKYYDTRVIVLAFMIIGTIFPAFFMLMSNYFYMEGLDFMEGVFVVPKGLSWFYILGLGAFAAMAQMFMTRAYGVAKAGIVGASSYAVILFSVIVGVMLGDNLPDLWGAFGIILVIIGGVLVANEKG